MNVCWIFGYYMGKVSCVAFSWSFNGLNLIIFFFEYLYFDFGEYQDLKHPLDSTFDIDGCNYFFLYYNRCVVGRYIKENLSSKCLSWTFQFDKPRSTSIHLISIKHNTHTILQYPNLFTREIPRPLTSSSS